MINRKQVVDLLHFRSGSDWVLSFYLGIRVYKGQSKAYEIEAKDIMKKALIDAGLKGEDKKRVEQDIRRILSFLRTDFKGRAKGLAIFGSGGADLWQVFRIPVTVPDRCVINHSPYVLPMLRLVDERRRYCIVVADKEKARLFTMYTGELYERTEIFDDVPGWHKQGGWAQARFQRHIEDAVNKHLKHTADTVFEFYKREGFGHLIIGGSQDVRHRLYRILHSYLQRIVAGYITVEVTSSANEILAAARKIEMEIEDREAGRIADALLAEASGGQLTVTGLKDTVRALEEGRVHTLVLVDDSKIEGSVCAYCGGVDVVEMDACHYCEKKLSPAGDVSEHLAMLAVRHDAEVDYVKRGSGLEARDGVGAILRW